MINVLESTLNKYDIQTVVISPEQCDLIRLRWRNAFLVEQNSTTHQKTEWHIFSYNLIPHLSGRDAIKAYHKLFIKNFIL